MKLHQDIKFFSDTLRAASQHLAIKLEFIEKDYWITLVLSRLAKSKYVTSSVFLFLRGLLSPQNKQYVHEGFAVCLL